MTARPRLAREADAEAENAAHWYEVRRSGLGLAFTNAVDAAVAQIVRWPDSGAPILRAPELGLRQVPVLGFPYHLVYMVIGGEPRVLAVAHDKRQRYYWMERIEDL